MRIIQIIYVILFVSVLIAPASWLIYKSNTEEGFSNKTLNYEKRAITLWPDRDVLDKKFIHYTAQINKFVEDRLLLRKQFVNLAARIKYHFLKQESSPRAIIAKDEWMFLKETTKNFIGQSDAPQERLEQWANGILNVKEQTEANGGKFFLVIPPDKAQVFSEKLMPEFKRSTEKRTLNRLKPLLAERGIDTFDLLSVMKDYKTTAKVQPIYFKTDTHWKHTTAFHAYQAIIDRFNQAGFSLPIADKSELQERNHPQHIGDIAGILGLGGTMNEIAPYPFITTPFKSAIREKTLLMYGDSFGAALQGYLPYSFIRVECFHHNFTRPNLSKIEEIKADIVLFQMIERGLRLPFSIDNESEKRCNP